MKATRRGAVIAVLLLLVAVMLLSEGAYRGVLRGMEEVERIASAQPLLAMAFVVLFSALGAMLAFVSSWLIVPFAIYNWGAIGALLLLWSGWLLGGALSYAIGRFLGRPVVRRLLPDAVSVRSEQWASRRMPFGLLVLVQFALPSEIPGYVLGIVRYSFGRYLAALGMVELVYGVMTVYLGQNVLERRVAPLLAGVAALALVTLGAARWFGRRAAREHRRGESEQMARRGTANGGRSASRVPLSALRVLGGADAE
jgi:uncharacterized membrane protein YdjX (TVP38/TMEM64 family)